MTTISAHTYDALREKFDELRAENARLVAELDVVRSTLNASDAVLSENLREKARLRAALAAAPRWVSVTERPPDTQETLTVKLDNGHYGYGMYNGAAWVPFNDWRRTVTHWLELPPAPGTEAER